jgi:DNA-binding protein HU-beta
VQQATGWSQEQAGEAVTAVLAAIGSIVAERDRLTLMNFGTFEVRLSAERPGRNPHSGAPMNVPPTWRLRFSPGAALRAKVANRPT